MKRLLLFLSLMLGIVMLSHAAGPYEDSFTASSTHAYADETWTGPSSRISYNVKDVTVVNQSGTKLYQQRKSNKYSSYIANEGTNTTKKIKSVKVTFYSDNTGTFNIYGSNSGPYTSYNDPQDGDYLGQLSGTSTVELSNIPTTKGDYKYIVIYPTGSEIARYTNITITWEDAVSAEAPGVPSFNPENGTAVEIGANVTVASTDASKIYYTIDGGDPTTSSDYIDNGGTITLTTAGSHTIKAMGWNSAGTSSVATATYTVNKEETLVSWSAENGAFTYRYGYTTTLPTVSTEPDGLALNYTSSDPSVATVSDAGVVTPLKEGTTTITATFTETATQQGSSDSYTLTVVKGEVMIEWDAVNDAFAYNWDGVYPTLTVIPDGVPVTYSSSNTAVATIDATTGAITPKAAGGTTTITATVAGTPLYDGASASYTLTVPAQTGWTDMIVASDFNLSNAASYTDVSGIKKATGNDITSNAIYAGNVARTSGNAIQMRYNNNCCLFTSAPGGYLTKVKVDWNSQTTGGRTVQVYGLESAPANAAAAITAISGETPIATLSYNKETPSESEVEKDILGNYQYLVFKVNGGSAYFDAIYFDWSAEERQKDPTTVIWSGVEDDAFSYTAGSSNVTWPTASIDVEGLTLSYASSDPTVATVSETGDITPKKGGTTTITASFGGNALYAESEASYELTIVKGQAIVRWDVENGEFTYDWHDVYPSVLTEPTGLALTYTSSNPSAATIDGATGVITPNEAGGETTIKAIFAGNDLYDGDEAEYVLHIPVRNFIEYQDKIQVGDLPAEKNTYKSFPDASANPPVAAKDKSNVELITSDAKYSGVTAKGKPSTTLPGNTASTEDCIQIGTTASGSSDTKYRGIYSSESGGLIRKVLVAWDRNTTTSSVVNVWGTNTRPTGTIQSVLNTSSADHPSYTKLGEIKKSDNATTLDITDDYKYVVLNVTGNAAYLSEINFEWEVVQETVVGPISFNPEPKTYYNDQTVTFTSTTEEGVDYSYKVNGEADSLSGNSVSLPGSYAATGLSEYSIAATGSKAGLLPANAAATYAFAVAPIILTTEAGVEVSPEMSFGSPFTVYIGTETVGATIGYKVNDGEMQTFTTTEEQKRVGVLISTDSEIQITASKAGYADATLEALYALGLDVPVISPIPGADELYTNNAEVTITSGSGTAIVYGLSNSVTEIPTTNVTVLPVEGSLTTATITLDSPKVVWAYSAMLDDDNNVTERSTSTKRYYDFKPATPTITIGDVVDDTRMLTLTTSTSTAELWVTLDGSEPTAENHVDLIYSDSYNKGTRASCNLTRVGIIRVSVKAVKSEYTNHPESEMATKLTFFEKPYVAKPFGLVTAPEQLSEGDEILLVYAPTKDAAGNPIPAKVMGSSSGTTASAYRTAVDVAAYSDGVGYNSSTKYIWNAPGYQVVTLVDYGNDTWLLRAGNDGFLHCSAKNTGRMPTNELGSSDESFVAKIYSYDDSDESSISFITDQNYDVRYNTKTDEARFAHYSRGSAEMSRIYIYKALDRTKVDNVAFAPTGKTLYEGNSVILHCANSNSKIYYNINSDEDPTTSSSVYDPKTGIVLDEAGEYVIKAFAVKDGLVNSDVTTSERYLVIKAEKYTLVESIDQLNENDRILIVSAIPYDENGATNSDRINKGTQYYALSLIQNDFYERYVTGQKVDRFLDPETGKITVLDESDNSAVIRLELAGTETDENRPWMFNIGAFAGMNSESQYLIAKGKSNNDKALGIITDPSDATNATIDFVDNLPLFNNSTDPARFDNCAVIHFSVNIVYDEGGNQIDTNLIPSLLRFNPSGGANDSDTRFFSCYLDANSGTYPVQIFRADNSIAPPTIEVVESMDPDTNSGSVFHNAIKVDINHPRLHTDDVEIYYVWLSDENYYPERSEYTLLADKDHVFDVDGDMVDGVQVAGPVLRVLAYDKVTHLTSQSVARKFNFKIENPTLNVSPGPDEVSGKYDELQSVAVNCTPTTQGATVIYTLDGTDPITSENWMSAPTGVISVNRSSQLVVAVVKSGYTKGEAAMTFDFSNIIIYQDAFATQLLQLTDGANKYFPGKSGQYLTYRPVEDITYEDKDYYIVSDLIDNSYYTAEIADRDLAEALMKDPSAYKWAACYFVRALDTEAYMEEMQDYVDAGVLPSIPVVGGETLKITVAEIEKVDNGSEIVNNVVESHDAYPMRVGGKTPYYGVLMDRLGNLSPGLFTSTFNYVIDNIDQAPTVSEISITPEVPKAYIKPNVRNYIYEAKQPELKLEDLPENAGKKYFKLQIPSSVPQKHEEMCDIYVEIKDLNPRRLDCDINFYRPNVSDRILEHYDIYYTIDIESYNAETDEYTTIVKGVYFDPEEQPTTEGVKNDNYRFVLQNVHPAMNTYPVLRVTGTEYRHNTNGQDAGYGERLTANYGDDIKLECVNTAVRGVPTLGSIDIRSYEMPDGTYDLIYMGHTDFSDPGDIVDDGGLGVPGGTMEEVEDPWQDVAEENILKPLFYHMEFYQPELNEYSGYNQLVKHYEDHGSEWKDYLYWHHVGTGFSTRKAPIVYLTPVYIFDHTIETGIEGNGINAVTELQIESQTEAPSPSMHRVIAGYGPAMDDNEVVDHTTSGKYEAVKGGTYSGYIGEEDGMTTGVEDVMLQENGDWDGTVLYFNLQGVRIEHPAKGNVYIVRRGKMVTKEVIL